MSVNKAYDTGGRYRVIQTAFAGDLILLMGRNVLGPATDHLAMNKLMALHLEQLERDHGIGDRVKLAKDHRYEQWQTVHAWVGSWPFPEARRAALDLTAQRPAELLRLRGAIEPLKDTRFLRKMNSALCGKLHFSLLLLQEEVGLKLLNSSPHVFAMCCLYTALHAKGAFLQDGFGLKHPHDQSQDKTFVGVPEGASLIMHGIEVICERHGSEIFASLDFSDSAARIANTMKVRANSKRSWFINTSEAVLLARNYLQGKINFWQMLNRLDRNMTERLPPSKRMSMLEADPVLFLTHLQGDFEALVERISFDYMTVHCACKTLFERMQRRMGDVTQGKKKQPSAGDWASHTTYALDITHAVLGQLDRALVVEGMMRKGMVTNRTVKTPKLDIAIDEIRSYCVAGGRGFAD